MVQDGKELGLPLEPGHSLLVLSKRRGEDLDGDMTAKIPVKGPIDLPHPAGADWVQDLITAGENSPRGDKADRRF
jgi:hypothetical protein